LAIVLAACSAAPATPPPATPLSPAAPPTERIVELASGRVISRDELLAAARASDYVLLGEQHDNARHHALRGEFLADLGTASLKTTTVVAEQLPQGSRVIFGADLLASLKAAGFDAAAWDWPVHAPLFDAIGRAGLPLTGGDVDRDTVRRAAREGETGLPTALADALRGAPLSAAAQAALDTDLVASHCGQLPAERVPGMRAAQGARDASLWAALQRSGGRPAVLVAGNGHVRLDYGVPRLIAAWQPAARVLSVGFVESDEDLAAARGLKLYHYAWVTAPPSDRGDPCEGFKAPAGAASAPAPGSADPAR
jgi:uncharacterized iron-regulated protein